MASEGVSLEHYTWTEIVLLYRITVWQILTHANGQTQRARRSAASLG